MIKHGMLLASLMALSVTAQAKGDAAAGEEKAMMCVAATARPAKPARPFTRISPGKMRRILNMRFRRTKKASAAAGRRKS